MPKWTTQQQAAIEDEGGTLLLSASAGSGKTAVLVERAFRLISAENPTSADRLLILTFSNAAAAELRSRIAQRLDHALEQDPGSMHLRRQKMLLQRAPISTVSAFCMQLLREQFSR
ncbi:MAG: UvrD-helicase domain-containing protein, partial [Pygmaiobacter massiliensis]